MHESCFRRSAEWAFGEQQKKSNRSPRSPEETTGTVGQQQCGAVERNAGGKEVARVVDPWGLYDAQPASWKLEGRPAFGCEFET